MVLRRSSLALVLAVACLAPPGVALAGDAASANPHTVHVGDRVCLVYTAPDGTQMARCRPEHGTWADAGPSLPTAVGLLLHAPPTDPWRAAGDRSRDRILFGTGLLLAHTGLVSVVWAAFQPCYIGLFGGPTNCPRLAGLVVGGLGLLIATISLGVDAIFRATWHFEPPSPGSADAQRHLATERLLFDVGAILFEAGIILDAAWVFNSSEPCVGPGCSLAEPLLATGLVANAAGALTLTADAIYRLHWDIDTTEFTISR